MMTDTLWQALRLNVSMIPWGWFAERLAVAAAVGFVLVVLIR